MYGNLLYSHVFLHVFANFYYEICCLFFLFFICLLTIKQVFPPSFWLSLYLCKDYSSNPTKRNKHVSFPFLVSPFYFTIWQYRIKLSFLAFTLILLNMHIFLLIELSVSNNILTPSSYRQDNQKIYLLTLYLSYTRYLFLLVYLLCIFRAYTIYILISCPYLHS